MDSPLFDFRRDDFGVDFYLNTKDGQVHLVSLDVSDEKAEEVCGALVRVYVYGGSIGSRRARRLMYGLKEHLDRLESEVEDIRREAFERVVDIENEIAADEDRLERMRREEAF